MVKRIIQVLLFIPVCCIDFFIFMPFRIMRWVVYGDNVEDRDLLIDKFMEW